MDPDGAMGGIRTCNRFSFSIIPCCWQYAHGNTQSVPDPPHCGQRLNTRTPTGTTPPSRLFRYERHRGPDPSHEGHPPSSPSVRMNTCFYLNETKDNHQRSRVKRANDEEHRRKRRPPLIGLAPPARQARCSRTLPRERRRGRDQMPLRLRVLKHYAHLRLCPEAAPHPRTTAVGGPRKDSAFARRPTAPHCRR